jgi:hypothetical protein
MRRKSKVATIKCAADLTILSRIAESSGLVAEHADAVDQFHVFNTGRILASELKSALWIDLTSKLDHAVQTGAIPHWVKLDRNNAPNRHRVDADHA